MVVLTNDLGYLIHFRLPLLVEMRDRGWSVTVICPPAEARLVESLRAIGADHVPWCTTKAGRNPLVELKALLSLYPTIRRLKPDLFYAQTIKPVLYGLPVARLAGVPRRVAVLTGLGYAFIEEPGWGRSLARKAAIAGYRVALGLADVLILQNPDDRDLLVAEGALADPTKARLVDGSGVDLSHYAFSPVPDGPPVFLMIARLLRDKGVYEYVAAARRVRRELPHARFVLVGGLDDNPAAVTPAEVEAWKAEGLIEHRGHLQDVRPELLACHVYVLPSYREGTPRTNLEAMAAGRAIVTTDVPGCRQTVVPGRNGFLVEARSAERLAEAMGRVGGDRALVERMGRESRRLCEERFEVSRVTEQTAAYVLGEA